LADRSDSLTTYEEARQCPKCHQYGVHAQTDSGPRGSKIETYVCDNEICLWYQTGWVVQVNRDGSIPNRTEGPKEFPMLSDTHRQAHEDYLERLAAEDGKGS